MTPCQLQSGRVDAGNKPWRSVVQPSPMIDDSRVWNPDPTELTATLESICLVSLNRGLCKSELASETMILIIWIFLFLFLFIFKFCMIINNILCTFVCCSVLVVNSQIHCILTGSVIEHIVIQVECIRAIVHKPVPNFANHSRTDHFVNYAESTLLLLHPAIGGGGRVSVRFIRFVGIQLERRHGRDPELLPEPVVSHIRHVDFVEPGVPMCW